MKYFLILISTLISSGCEKPTPIDEKQQLVNKVRIKAIMKIKKEKNLTPSGISAQMAYDIEMLGLIFFYYKHLEIDEGRELIVYSAQKLSEEINAEPRIHPYLSKYPFPPQKTEIDIYLYNLDGSLFPPGELLIISLADGIIKYKMEDPQTTHLKTICQETYEEALEKLNHLDAEVSGL